MPDTTTAAPPIPAANGVDCLDCPGFANYHRNAVECPNTGDGNGSDPDGRHVTVPVFITDTPLGRPDDDDNRVGRRDLWVYEATT